jgi:hypothetical protein
MKTTQPKVQKIEGVFYVVTYIKYSDKKQVKRIYNLNGELVDAVPTQITNIKG